MFYSIKVKRFCEQKLEILTFSETKHSQRIFFDLVIFSFEHDMIPILLTDFAFKLVLMILLLSFFLSFSKHVLAASFRSTRRR